MIIQNRRVHKRGFRSNFFFARRRERDERHIGTTKWNNRTNSELYGQYIIESVAIFFELKINDRLQNESTTLQM